MKFSLGLDLCYGKAITINIRFFCKVCKVIDVKNPLSWSGERGYIPKTDLRKAHLEK